MGTSQNLHRKHSQAFFPSVNFATNSKNIPPSSSLPVSRRDDIVYRGWWWVSGGAQWLTQTVGSCLGEHEPVSDVELGDQTVLHYLVQVIARGTPQAAAEHWSILGCVLLTHRAEIIYLVIKRTTIFINWRWELCDTYSTGEGLSWQITDGHHRKNAWKHWEAQGKKSFALVTSWPTENLWDWPCEQMEQRSVFQRACWRMIHTLPRSWSTGTLAHRWEMDHLIREMVDNCR